MPDTWLLKFEVLWTLQRQQIFTEYDSRSIGVQVFPLYNEVIFFSYLAEVDPFLMNEMALTESMSKLTLTPI